MRAAEKRKQGTSGTVPFDHLSEAEHQKLDKIAATMIYDTGLPLSFFEHTSVKAFFRQLRPAWHPPSRDTLSESLLEDVYEDTKKEVDSYLDTQDYLNCCFDESTNIKGDRVMNLSLTTEKGAFFDSNIDLGAATVSAEFCADLAEKRLQTVTRGKMSRVNSFCTDTCSPMLSALRQLKQRPDLQHTFTIPCDPHGLQLLIQDICEDVAYKELVANANTIVGFLKNAKKQYQIFKEIQRGIYKGKCYSLILSCDVRWGTYSGEFERLLLTATALKDWTRDPRITEEARKSQKLRTVINFIQNPRFWLHLAELSDTISPIYKHQVMAQTDHAHVGYVRGRWDAIWEHLKQCEGRATFGDYSRLWPVLEQRKKRQLIPLHTLAHWLMPQTVLTSRFSPGKPPSFLE